MTAFDTNVLIYSCDKADRTRQRTAIELIAQTEDGVLLWQVACEFIAASRKLARQGFGPRDAWNRLSELMALFPVILPDRIVFDKAQELHVQQRWSYWDAMIVAACLAGGVKKLYTEDLPGGETIDPLEIVNPFK